MTAGSQCTATEDPSLSRMTMRIDEREKKFYQKYYKGLEGATIKTAGINDDCFPFFTFEKDGKEFTCEISQDPEGNGPGFLFGLPRPG